MSRIEKLLEQKGPEKWYHRFEVSDGIYTKGHLNIDVLNILKKLNIEVQELIGKRLLDVGTFNGGWAFGFEELGAEVVTIDIHDPKNMGLELVKEIKKSKIKSYKMSIYDIKKEELGEFDYIFYSGVFYHLKHPILALENLNKVAKDETIIFGHGTCCDSYISNNDKYSFNMKETNNEVNNFPMAHFVRDRYINSNNNWFIPNRACYEAWLKRAGFETISIIVQTGKHILPQTDIEINRSNLYYKAKKISTPEAEYEVLDESYYRPKGTKGKWSDNTWLNI